MSAQNINHFNWRFTSQAVAGGAANSLGDSVLQFRPARPILIRSLHLGAIKNTIATGTRSLPIACTLSLSSGFAYNTFDMPDGFTWAQTQTAVDYFFAAGQNPYDLRLRVSNGSQFIYQFSALAYVDVVVNDTVTFYYHMTWELDSNY